MSYEQIWAPWRLAYVQECQNVQTSETEPLELLPGGDVECFLCRGAADPASPHRLVVHRTESCVTVLNRYPYNNGHLLVAPLFHRARLDQLNRDELADLAEEVTRMVGVLEKIFQPQDSTWG